MARFKPNENRYISIEKISVEKDGDSSWRSNLYSCIKNNITDANDESLEATTTSQTIIGNNIKENSFNVNPNVHLLMEDGFPKISIQNTYKHPIADIFNKSITIGGKDVSMNSFLTGATDIVQALNSGTTDESINQARASFYPWISNTPALSMDSASLSPVSFSYKFTFKLGQYGLWNAQEEVVKPILNLFAPCAPRALGEATITPNIPTINQMYINMFLGVFKSSENKTKITDNKSLASVLLNSLYKLYKNMAYNIYFGSMVFNNMMFDSVNDLHFSSELDTNGFPIMGSIDIKFTGIMPITLTSSLNNDNGIALTIRKGSKY